MADKLDWQPGFLGYGVFDQDGTFYEWIIDEEGNPTFEAFTRSIGIKAGSNAFLINPTGAVNYLPQDSELALHIPYIDDRLSLDEANDFTMDADSDDWSAMKYLETPDSHLSMEINHKKPKPQRKQPRGLSEDEWEQMKLDWAESDDGEGKPLPDDFEQEHWRHDHLPHLSPKRGTDDNYRTLYHATYAANRNTILAYGLQVSNPLAQERTFPNAPEGQPHGVYLWENKGDALFMAGDLGQVKNDWGVSPRQPDSAALASADIWKVRVPEEKLISDPATGAYYVNQSIPPEQLELDTDWQTGAFEQSYDMGRTDQHQVPNSIETPPPSYRAIPLAKVGLYRGITTPIRELYNELSVRGWEVTKVDWNKNQYTATATSENGDQIEAAGVNDQTAVGNLLIQVLRMENMRQPKFARWETNFTNMIEEVAQAYAKAPVYDPKAAIAWMELAQDSIRRGQELQQQLDVEWVPDPEPYQSPQEMFDDIHNNDHISVSTANSQHPVWSSEENAYFRLVHDVLGHGVSGGDFGWEGENRACAAHFPLLTPLAQKALFTECIGQTAAAAYYRNFFPQKVVFLDEFIEPAMANENPIDHQGVHPSQSLAPAQTPQTQPSEQTLWPDPGYNALSWSTNVPHADFQGALPVFGKTAKYTLFEGTQEHDLGQPDDNWPEGHWDWRRPILFNKEEGTVLVGRPGTHHYDVSREFSDEYGNVEPSGGWYQGWIVSDPANEVAHGNGKVELWDTYGLFDTAPILQEIWETVYPGQPYAPSLEEEDEWEVMSSVDDLTDPNAGWQSDIFPSDESNAYLWHNDPIGINEVRDSAQNLDTGWSKLKRADGSPDVTAQKQAVANALRVALLSPRTNLKWNAVHYQDLLGIPYDCDDPQRYWDTLSQKRNEWNQSRGFEEDSHKAYAKNLKKLKRIEQSKNPSMPPDEVHKMVEAQILNLRADLEERIFEEKPDIDPLKANTKVDSELNKQLKIMIETVQDEMDHPKPQREPSKKEYNKLRDKQNLKLEGAKKPFPGQVDLLSDEIMGETMTKSGHPTRYGAFFAQTMIALAQVSQHIDEIWESAVQDANEGGQGYRFRKELLDLGIKGISSKIASFAWLILQPLTSELATIDVHMLDALGYGDKKTTTKRDYFRHERELAAARDSMGYGHMPLGQFQWGMWDIRRTGEGSHQDHSSLRALDPMHHSQVDWQEQAQQQRDKDWEQPDWWKMTEGPRSDVATAWDEEFGKQFPQSKYPFISKTADSRPDVNDPPLEKYRYWWDKEKREKGDFKGQDGKLMAEYAAGVRLPKKQATKFLDNHLDDIKRMSRRTFKKKFWETLDRLAERLYPREYVAKIQKKAEIIPWVLNGEEIYYGTPGSTYMSLAKETFNLSSEEIWKMLPEPGFSAGTLDTDTGEVFSIESLSSQQKERIKAIS